MEAVSDEEAKSLASHWVKRIESSILGQIDQSTSVVKASFKSDGDQHFAKQDSYGDEVNRRVRRCCRTSNGCSLNHKKSNVNGFLEERAYNHHNYRPEFEFTCDESNSSGLKIVKEPDDRMVPQNQPLHSGQYTPRVDIDFIRQKRLAFFDVEHNPNRGCSDRVQLNTNSNVVHKQATNSKPTCDVHNVFTTEPCTHDLDSPGNNFTLVHDSCDSLSHLQWLKASLSPTLNSQCKGENEFFQQYASFVESKEEEDIRLELWGLKDVVNSGELDLKVYLQEPTGKSHQLPVGRPQQMLSKSFHKRKDSYLEDNEGQIFCMDLPVGGLKNVELFDDKSKSKAYAMSGNNTRNLQLTDTSDQYLNSCGPAYEVHSSEHFNTSFSKSYLEGTENINNCFHVPRPQIYGPLYSGFENSDSESSLLSFGSTCKEVNYRKVVKKRDSSNNKKNSSPHEKHENRSSARKRGKEKILLELTHFIEGAESPQVEEGLLNQTSSGILADKHFKENTSFPAETVTKSCVEVGGVENLNTQGNYGVHSINEPCITRHRLSSNDIEFNGNDQCSEICRKAMGKICPECIELNSSAANWCIECGTALVSLKPSALTGQQQKCWKEKHLQTEAIIKDTLKREDIAAEKQVKQLHNDISSLSLQASHSSTELGGLKHSSHRGYSRHWTRSSTAWSSFNPGELSKSSSCLVERSKNKRKNKCVGTGAEEPMRARSASELQNGYTSTKDTADGNRRKTTWTKPVRQRASSCNLPGCSAGEAFNALERGRKLKHHDHPQSTHSSSRCNFVGNGDTTTAFVKRPPSATVQHQQTVLGYSAIPQDNSAGHQLESSSSSFCVDEVRQTTLQATKPFVPPLNLQDVDSYDRILTLIRTQRESEPVAYLYLPDEILLKIFSFVCQKDLSACSRVCWQFYRISMDESLWKAIVIKKNRNITDEWLCAIGKHRPLRLTLSQCHGNKVTTKGLRELFRSCSDTLEELDFSGCRGGELIGESILLHVAARCRWLRSVDASWSNVGDTGVQALVDNVASLRCLCLNGCPAITDESIKFVANKHGTTLRIFEMFGCFNITPAGIKILGHSCKQLQTLNIGQCHKITDSAIGSLVSNLSELENLDLRGCKQARDSSVKKIVRYCPLVINLVLANCPYITDVSLAEIATNIPKIRSLDICGCAKVSDNGIRALSKGCRRLELLDLTSTGVSHKSVLSLANYCSQSLCNLKLSFCSDISDHTVAHLARHCKRLTTLHLYGCKRIRNASALRSLNPALTIEC